MALENYQCLDLFQLAIMFFPSRKMARKRMLELYRKKKVKRMRLEIDQPNVYYIDKANEDIVRLNWVRLYLEKRQAFGDTPVQFDYEKLMITYENPLTKQRRQTKIELHRRRLDFGSGSSVFYVDNKRIEEVKEALLCECS
jgi:hypothetical protein